MFSFLHLLANFVCVPFRVGQVELLYQRKTRLMRAEIEDQNNELKVAKRLRRATGN